MFELPAEKLEKKALSAWFWHGLLTGFLLLIIPAGYFLADNLLFDLPLWGGRLLVLVIVVLTLLQAIFIPRLRIKFWRYEIQENEIDIQHGIFIIKRSLIPMARVQHVDTEQGPVLRRFNLANLRIFTAGSTHRIPALSAKKAQILRNQIAYLAGVSDDDV